MHPTASIDCRCGSIPSALAESRRIAPFDGVEPDKVQHSVAKGFTIRGIEHMDTIRFHGNGSDVFDVLARVIDDLIRGDERSVDVVGIHQPRTFTSRIIFKPDNVGFALRIVGYRCIHRLVAGIGTICVGAVQVTDCCAANAFVFQENTTIISKPKGTNARRKNFEDFVME